MLIGGLTLVSPKQAHAFSSTALSSYFQANDVHIDQNGNLFVSWQKVQLGFIPYGLSNQDILVMINATTSFTDDTYLVGNYQDPPAGGCATGYDGFAGASQAVGGNSSTFSTVWDGNSGTFVAANTIGFTTPIYFVLIGKSNSTFLCFANVFTYQDAQETFVNSINLPLTSFFINPFASGTFQDFPNWSLDLSNNSSSAATGTIGVYYGAGATTTNLLDTTTFYVAPNADTQILIPKSSALTYPQQGTSTLQWNAFIAVTSTVSDVQMDNPIIFYTNPQAQAGQNPIQNIFNQSTTNEYSVQCSYTTSSFFVDPSGNIQTGFCNVLVWAFVPTNNQENDLSTRFQNIGALVSSKPPIGYFALIANQLNGLSGSSTATTTLMDSSTTAIIAGTFSTLDEGLASIVSFLFALWIFHRFRLFNL